MSDSTTDKKEWKSPFDNLVSKFIEIKNSIKRQKNADFAKNII